MLPGTNGATWWEGERGELGPRGCATTLGLEGNGTDFGAR